MDADFDDDSSEDDDYVPDKKAIVKTEKEIAKQNGTKPAVDEDRALTGIEKIKLQKR